MQRSLLRVSRPCKHGLPHTGRLSPQLPAVLTRYRSLSTLPSEPTPTPEVVYKGPLTNTFRRLKIFSLSSLTLSAALSPFIFVIEAAGIPLGARFALAGVAMATSGVSTALVAWCGSPYVTRLQRIEKDNALQMTTLTLGLNERITNVYDTSFLKETSRGFAKWELADHLTLEGKEQQRRVVAGTQETVAETMDSKGGLVGSWVVTWGENGEGTCKPVGKVHRCAHFISHNQAEAYEYSFRRQVLQRSRGAPTTERPVAQDCIPPAFYTTLWSFISTQPFHNLHPLLSKAFFTFGSRLFGATARHVGISSGCSIQR